ncbi:MAG: hypothetical protein LLG00_13070 [Planctomycetaceae bacterium]|nr:hypothetical protein [Planctomycetaceae bacterium]
MILIDERTADGSRRFGELSRTAAWENICQHTLLLPGAEIGHCMRHEVAGTWLHFTFNGHRFRVHDRCDHLHLYVDDPLCSDLVLYQVGRHFELLMRESGQ